jgi:hypothetical protein
MLPNGMAGVEFHHEHRAVYKNLLEHDDYLYRYISSDDRLNRIVVVWADFFYRQSVMPFVDRREQLFADSGRWVKGDTSKVKGSTIGKKASH